MRARDPVHGALTQLIHPLIYTQDSVRRFVTLFSSRRPSKSEGKLMWIGLHDGTGREVRSVDQSHQGHEPRRAKLQDQSMVEELIENLFKLAKRGEVPQFFLRSIQRFRRLEMERRIDPPRHRAESAASAMTSGRAATKLRGHSGRAQRVRR